MKLSLSLVALGALTCSAVPTAPKTTTKVISANFDDLTASALLPELDLIHPDYHHLAWNELGAYKDTLAAVKPHSGSQVGESSTIQQIIAGTAPNITSIYSGSTTISYAITSMYVGCVLPAAAGVGVLSLPCTLQFTGHRAQGANPATVTKECQFTGGSSLQLCTFPSNFNDLQSTTFAPVGDVLNLAAVILIDDFLGSVTM